jgi:hypothetical protein
VGKAGEGGKSRKNGEDGISDCIMQWHLGILAGIEVVTKWVTLFVAVSARRGARKDRDLQFTLEEDGVEVIAEVVIGKVSRKGVHGDAGKGRKKQWEGGCLCGFDILNGEHHCMGLVC